MKPFEFIYERITGKLAAKRPGKVINIDPDTYNQPEVDTPPPPQATIPPAGKTITTIKPGTAQARPPTTRPAASPPDTSNKPLVTKQAGAINRGIKSADGPEHNYDLATGFVKNDPNAGAEVDSEEDGEEEKGGSSKVSKKAWEVGLNKFNPNTVLVNENDEALIIQSFFSVPMISDSFHQQNKPFMGTDLYQNLVATFDISSVGEVKEEIEFQPKRRPGDAVRLPSYSTLPVQGWKSGQGEGDRAKYKIEFTDTVNMKQAETLASRAVYSAFRGKDLVLADGKFPIHWVNPDARDGATSFALCHWIKTPNQDFPKAGDQVALKKYVSDNEIKHYVFGYYDTAGILVNPGQADQIFGGFNVGYIEKVVGFYGTGGIVDRRLSALHPSTALGMKVGEYETTSVNILNRNLEGLTLTKPWTQIIEKIETSYSSAKNPEKAPALVDITERVIGKSVNSPSNYPIRFDNIELKTVGFSTNAVAVDFMEILHPLILMKPDGAINNGLYDAAMTYFGSADLSGCKVFYPDAKNAPMFDSLLVSGNKYLMISSKAGEGATPSITGLGTAYESLAGNNKLPTQVKKRFQELNANPNYPQLLNFFTALQSGETEESLRNKMPRSAGARRIANDILIMKNLSGTQKQDGMNRQGWGERIAAELNRFGDGGFLEYCEFVMSATNLVQVNTQYTTSKDAKGELSIDGFMATWPNAVYDKIQFSYLGSTLKFKLAVGGKADAQDITGPDFEKYRGYTGSGEKKDIPRYSSPTNFAGLVVPGTKGLNVDGKKMKSDLKWFSAIKGLEKDYRKFINTFKKESDRIKQREAIRQLKPLYDSITGVLNKVGHNPSIESGVDTTTRDLLANIKQLLGN